MRSLRLTHYTPSIQTAVYTSLYHLLRFRRTWGQSTVPWIGSRGIQGGPQRSVGSVCREFAKIGVMLRWIRFDVLLLLAVANSVPVLVSMLLGARWAAPIDGGRVLRDGRPLFGLHKTWRGFLSGALATSAAGALLPVGFVTALGVGFLALLGDLLSSFIKRRSNLHSGQDSLLLDQIPESLLPLTFLYALLELDVASLIGTFTVFVLLAMAAAKVFTYRRTPQS